MAKFSRLNYVLNVSKLDFINEVKRFDVPKRFGLVKVTGMYSLSIGDIIRLWDVSDNNELMEVAKEIFLTDKWYKELLLPKTELLPMIKFTRLIIHAEETGKHAAQMFGKLKVNHSDSRMDAILSKYEGDPMDMISRFCKMFPSYTIKEALKVSWYDVYLAFKTDTKDANIQLEVSQLKPLNS